MAAPSPAAGGGVTLLSTRPLPTLQAHPIGHVHLGHAEGTPRLQTLAFACRAPSSRAGTDVDANLVPAAAVEGGVVLSLGYANGTVQLVPLYT